MNNDRVIHLENLDEHIGKKLLFIGVEKLSATLELTLGEKPYAIRRNCSTYAEEQERFSPATRKRDRVELPS